MRASLSSYLPTGGAKPREREDPPPAFHAAMRGSRIRKHPHRRLSNRRAIDARTVSNAARDRARRRKRGRHEA